MGKVSVCRDMCVSVGSRVFRTRVKDLCVGDTCEGLECVGHVCEGLVCVGHM